jgi:branched-chain amino acid transport system permease protein
MPNIRIGLSGSTQQAATQLRSAFPGSPGGRDYRLAFDRYGSTVIATIVLALVPLFLAGAYQLSLAITILTYSITLVGLNLLVGEIGLLSFSQAAFMAVGAYASVFFSMHLKWAFPASLAAAVLVTMLVAVLLAVPATRLASWSFGLVTFGFALVVDTWLNGFLLANWTGGSAGEYAAPGNLLGLPVGGIRNSTYYVILIGLAITMGLATCIVHSRPGRALRAIKANELVAVTLGVPIRRYKVGVFAFAAALAAFAGVMTAQAEGFISPSAFDLNQSILLMAMLIVGGTGRQLGPIVGAGFFVLLPEFMQGQGVQNESAIIFAALFLGALILAPQGLVGLVEKGWRWGWRWLGTRKVGQPGTLSAAADPGVRSDRQDAASECVVKVEES